MRYLNGLLAILTIGIWIPVGLVLWIPLVARAAVWSIFLAVSSAIAHRSATAATPALERAFKFWGQGFHFILESFKEGTGKNGPQKIPIVDSLKVAAWAIIFWASLILPPLLLTMSDALHSVKGVADAALPKPTVASSATTIIDSQAISIARDKYWDTTFAIPSDKCTLEGTVEGIAGASRDFIVLVATGDQFEAYSSGASNVSVLFESEKTNRVELSVPLARGSYHLVVSNKFSTFTDKWVRLSHILSRCEGQPSAPLQPR